MKRDFTLTVNGDEYSVAVDPQTPLLWVLRDELKLTGTKYGCGKAICGCCTVHVANAPIRSCSVPVASVVNLPITTIEGIADPDPHPVQKAWVEENVPQCGYCQNGQIMTAIAHYNKTPKLDKLNFQQALSGNLCRCGTYPGINRAIDRLVNEQSN